MKRIVAVAMISASVAAAPAPAPEPSAAPAGDALSLLAETEVDRAVERGLAYLAGKQAREGYWASPGHGGRSTGITSLCVMAFLAKGYEAGGGTYGEVIDGGLRYVLSNQKQDGMLIATTGHGPMYDHGISTLMLAEILGMAPPAQAAEVRDKLAKAIALILKAQTPRGRPKDARSRGGWRYQTQSTDSDISCTGWQLMSLRAAKNCGCDVPIEAIHEGVGYILICASRDSRGGFGYQAGGGPNVARSGTGIVALELCDQHRHPLALRAGDYIARERIHPSMEFFWYAMYYGSQAMFQLGDTYWEPFRVRMERLLLQIQKPDGSFPEGPGNENAAGKAYATAMACLSLSVGYQLLPIYQRGEDDPGK
ncbi:MAG: prenyltransferase [Planctomycetes bacterium]|nr:prenyltransferase [Planctomycetota bacterium]